MTRLFFLATALFLSAAACTSDPYEHSSPDAPFLAPQDSGLVNNDLLAEVSGLVASRKNSHALWVLNDSGNEPECYLISTQGKLLGIYRVAEGVNFDWEDMAIGPGPVAGETYLYLGDIGDNVDMYDARFIYRFVEPTYVPDTAVVLDTIKQYDRLSYFYPKGARNAETLLLDPITQDLYVLTKSKSQVQVYQMDYPPAPPYRQAAQRMATLPFQGTNLIDKVVGGDISPNGMEVLLKTYEHVLYWSREDTTISIPNLLLLPPDTLPYLPEPQGEAIGFAPDGSGYYTLSEENLGADIHLYFYPRRSANSTAVGLRP